MFHESQRYHWPDGINGLFKKRKRYWHALEMNGSLVNYRQICHRAISRIGAFGIFKSQLSVCVFWRSSMITCLCSIANNSLAPVASANSIIIYRCAHLSLSTPSLNLFLISVLIELLQIPVVPNAFSFTI